MSKILNLTNITLAALATELVATVTNANKYIVIDNTGSNPATWAPTEGDVVNGITIPAGTKERIQFTDTSVTTLEVWVNSVLGTDLTVIFN